VPGVRAVRAVRDRTFRERETRIAHDAPPGAVYRHTLTTLPDGRVLVVGGDVGGEGTTACWLFDSTTGRIQTAAPAPIELSNHTATLLPDGTVLVAGGSSALIEAYGYLYHPLFDAWTRTSAMPIAHAGRPCAILLENGDVLLVGGEVNGTPTAMTSIYRHSSGQWVNGTAMVEARTDAALVHGPDRTVLIFGGAGLVQPERYDPAIDAWTEEPATPECLLGFGTRALPLNDGRVLVIAGRTGGGDIGVAVDAAYVYDPEAHEFTALTAPGWLAAFRADAACIVCDDGKVLICGGQEEEYGGDLQALFDPFTGTFTHVGLPSNDVFIDTVAHAQLAWLPGNRVLAWGGMISDQNPSVAAGVLDLRESADTRQWSTVGDGTFPARTFDAGAFGVDVVLDGVPSSAIDLTPSPTIEVAP